MEQLLWIFAIAFLLSWIPALLNFLRARHRFSGSRKVTCPETHREASIRLDAVHAAKTGLTGEPDFKIRSCNRWGGPVGHCAQGCVDEIETRLVEGAQSA